MLIITGASGWLGSRLLEVLRLVPEEVPGAWEWNTVPIRCLIRPDENAEILSQLLQVELIRGDLTRSDSLSALFAKAGGATVIHLAGMIHPRRFTRDFIEVNVKGTRNILELSQKAGVRNVVLMSSNSPCGCNPHPGHRFTEDSPYNPYMGYGRSKMLMEMLVSEYRTKLATTILRTCWFYGPHQPDRQTRFFQLIKEGKFPILGGGEQVRSLSYVDNTCQGILLAAAQPAAAGQTYWIADERPYTMNEIVRTVSEVLKQDFGMPVVESSRRWPGWLADVAYGADAIIQAVGLYQKEIHVLSEMNRSIACSVEKAKRDLGYKPQIALREGMRRSIAWCLERGQTF